MISLITAILLFSASSVSAFNEPEDFRGFKWGTTIEELKSVAPHIGSAISHGPRIKQYFSTRHRIGSALVDLTYGFLDDKFASVQIKIKSDDFASMKGSFTERYGPLQSNWEEALQTAAGANFVNEILAWSGPTILVELRKYSGNILEGHGHIMQRDFAAEFVRAYQEKRKEGAKDL